MTLRFTEDEYKALLRRKATNTPAAFVASPRAGRKSEDEFAALLDALVIPYQREHRFLPGRRFRFDFVMLPLCMKLAVEIDGAVHRIEKQWQSDREKGNLALADGWRVFHFGLGQVRSGEAAELIRNALISRPIRSAK